MRCCDQDPRRYFLCGMRWMFGAWLLYVGLVKWLVFGPQGFVGLIATDFDKTWSPHLLNVALAWLIMVAEPVGALWILSGKCPRSAWSATTLLMFLLTIGQTMLMKPTVIENWTFVIITLTCAALSDPDRTET